MDRSQKSLETQFDAVHPVRLARLATTLMRARSLCMTHSHAGSLYCDVIFCSMSLAWVVELLSLHPKFANWACDDFLCFTNAICMKHVSELLGVTVAVLFASQNEFLM